VLAVRFSAEGQWLASGYMDGSVILWDLPRQTIRQHFRGHQHSVWDVAFHPTAGLLASASYDHTVKLWDIDSGTCYKTLTGYTGPSFSVAFCEDANHLISSSFDRTLKLWDLQTETCTRTLYGHSGPVSSLTLLADQANWFVPSLLAHPPASQYLVSGSFDETLRLWDLDTGECLASLRTPRPYDSMNILAITGLTEAQKVTLKALGAVERY
jgi:WD40 repeat protein